MKIIYCGFGRAGLECLYQLLCEFKINSDELMVFTHDTKENEEFLTHLKYNNIEYTFDNVNEHVENLIAFNPEYLISIYYRYIVYTDILKCVNYRAMNLHPSLLPTYRGTKSSVWALINEEKYTGITFHYMNEKIDDGNIILQEKIPIQQEDSAFSLYHKLIGVFSQKFNKAFNLLIDNFEGTKQKGEISYYSRKLPFNGMLKFSEIDYQEAENFIRAMYFPPYQGALFENNDGKVVEIQNVKKLVKYKNLIGKKA